MMNLEVTSPMLRELASPSSVTCSSESASAEASPALRPNVVYQGTFGAESEEGSFSYLKVDSLIDIESVKDQISKADISVEWH